MHIAHGGICLIEWTAPKVELWNEFICIGDSDLKGWASHCSASVHAPREKPNDSFYRWTRAIFLNCHCSEWQLVGRLPCWRSPIFGRLRLLIQYIRSLPPYVEAVSSIRNPRMLDRILQKNIQSKCAVWSWGCNTHGRDDALNLRLRAWKEETFVKRGGKYWFEFEAFREIVWCIQVIQHKRQQWQTQVSTVKQSRLL
jgi:hypothetical protein